MYSKTKKELKVLGCEMYTQKRGQKYEKNLQNQ